MMNLFSSFGLTCDAGNDRAKGHIDADEVSVHVGDVEKPVVLLPRKSNATSAIGKPVDIRKLTDPHGANIGSHMWSCAYQTYFCLPSNGPGNFDQGEVHLPHRPSARENFTPMYPQVVFLKSHTIPDKEHPILQKKSIESIDPEQTLDSSIDGTDEGRTSPRRNLTHLQYKKLAAFHNFIGSSHLTETTQSTMAPPEPDLERSISSSSALNTCVGCKARTFTLPFVPLGSDPQIPQPHVYLCTSCTLLVDYTARQTPITFTFDDELKEKSSKFVKELSNKLELETLEYLAHPQFMEEIQKKKMELDMELIEPEREREPDLVSRKSGHVIHYDIASHSASIHYDIASHSASILAYDIASHSASILAYDTFLYDISTPSIRLREADYGDQVDVFEMNTSHDTINNSSICEIYSNLEPSETLQIF